MLKDCIISPYCWTTFSGLSTPLRPSNLSLSRPSILLRKLTPSSVTVPFSLTSRSFKEGNSLRANIFKETSFKYLKNYSEEEMEALFLTRNF